MEGEGEGSFLTFPTFPPKQLHLDLHFLSFDIKVLLYHGPRPLFTHSLSFSLAYKLQSHILMSQVPPIFIVDLILLKIFPFFLEIMALRTVTSYEPQSTQANEELPSESSLDLTPTQHPRDKEPKPREVCTCLEVEPP
jgi:hypothetical protein